MTAHTANAPAPPWNRPLPQLKLSPRAWRTLRHVGTAWAALCLTGPAVLIALSLMLFVLPVAAIASPFLLFAARGMPWRAGPRRRLPLLQFT